MLRNIGFFFSSRRRHTRWPRDWSSDVCSSDLLGSLQFNSKNAGLAAFLRFSERPNWKIMENGKRPARGERKLLQSVRRPGALQERISAFPALSNRESHTSRFPASFPFTGHKRVCRYLSGGQFPVSR